MEKDNVPLLLGDRLAGGTATLVLWLLAPFLLLATVAVLGAGFASMAIFSLRDAMAGWMERR